MPKNSITPSNLRPAGDGPIQSKIASAFFSPVNSKEELQKIINAGKATRNIQQALEQKRINEKVAWADEANLMKDRPTPTLVALTEANKNLKDLAKLQQSTADENKKLLEGIPAGIAGLLPPPKAKKDKSKQIEGNKSDDNKGPSAEVIHHEKPSHVVRKDRPYEYFKGDATQGVFGRKGDTITFRPNGDGYEVDLYEYVTDDQPDELVYRANISKALYKLIRYQGDIDHFKQHYQETLTETDENVYKELLEQASGKKSKGNLGKKLGALAYWVNQNKNREGPPAEAPQHAEQLEPIIEEPEEPQAVENQGEGIQTPKGRFTIDPTHWAKGRFVVKNGKKTVINSKFDHTFPKLLSERHNPRYPYTGASIELYRKFVHHTGLPISKASKKYQLIFGPQDMLEKLRLNMESMAAGNKSTDVYNESVAIADKLYTEGKFSEEQHNTALKTLARLLGK